MFQGPLERSLKLKNAGNVFYKKGEYTEAVRCYTEAISVCPPAEREQLATFYQNRAAAYEALVSYICSVKYFVIH